MASITTINGSDVISTSDTTINDNFTNLNTDKIETSYLDTDTALTANSDVKIATQRAVKTYIDTSGGVNASETVRGIVEEATSAEVTAGTDTGATGAKLFVTPAKLQTYLSSVYQPIIVFACGAATKNLADASTTQNIAHGLGVTPKYVKISGKTNGGNTTISMADTVYNGTTQASNYVWISDSNAEAAGATFLLLGEDNPGGQTGVITFDATNIIITWTKSGSNPTGTAYLVWEAQK